MITLGFGGLGNMSLEEEIALQEVMALKMKALLEEHGWLDEYGRDPVLILIEYEESHLNDEENDA